MQATDPPALHLLQTPNSTPLLLGSYSRPAFPTYAISEPRWTCGYGLSHCAGTGCPERISAPCHSPTLFSLEHPSLHFPNISSVSLSPLKLSPMVPAKVSSLPFCSLNSVFQFFLTRLGAHQGQCTVSYLIPSAQGLMYNAPWLLGATLRKREHEPES